jgi:hypothetical protein
VEGYWKDSKKFYYTHINTPEQVDITNRTVLEGKESALCAGLLTHKADNSLALYPRVEEPKQDKDRRQEAKHIHHATSRKQKALLGLGTVGTPADHGQPKSEEQEGVLLEERLKPGFFLTLFHHSAPKIMPMNTESAKA